MKHQNAKKINKKFPKYIELKGFLSFFILHELSSRPMSGDNLADTIGKRRNSRLTPGTIYPALKRLKKQKLVIYRREGRKKMYSLTKTGLEELRAFYSVLGRFFSGFKAKLR